MTIQEKKTHLTTVHEDGSLLVKTFTIYLKDGVEVGRSSPNTRTIHAGDDVSAQADIVKEIASAIHTQDRRDARAARVAEQEATKQDKVRNVT